MKKALVVGTVLASALLLTSQAHAQCGGGFGISICGQIVVTPPPVPVILPPPVYTPPPVYLPPPVVYSPPVYVAPPVVYAPPPVVYTPPPVVYTPPPPPPIVVTPAPVVYAAPQPTIMMTASEPVAVPAPRAFVRHRGFGFGVRASGGYAGLTDMGMYGGGAVLRYNTGPAFGLELTVDGYGGTGYGGAERIEFPVTVNGLWYVNPRSHVQLYVLGGLGLSVAEVSANGDTDDPIYGGGQLGLGVEFLIGSHVGLTLDVRGFLRGRMNERPEGNLAHDGSCRPAEGGGTECTDLEAGATFNAGFNFYL